jgi:hypothetical protein
MKVFGSFVNPKGMTFFGFGGSLPYISLLYWHLVVAIIQIILTKLFSPLELVKDIVNSGK